VLCATTGEFIITDAHEDDVFPNEDFFPDIDNLFGDMSLVRCIYLYIVVSPYVRGLPAYLHLYLYYILWPLAPR
jgi:hypothetical protein